MLIRLFVAVFISCSFASYAAEKQNEITLPGGKTIVPADEQFGSLMGYYKQYRSSHPEVAEQLHRAIQDKVGNGLKEISRPRTVSDAEIEQYVKDVLSNKKGKEAAAELTSITQKLQDEGNIDVVARVRTEIDKNMMRTKSPEFQMAFQRAVIITLSKTNNRYGFVDVAKKQLEEANTIFDVSYLRNHPTEFVARLAKLTQLSNDIEASIRALTPLNERIFKHEDGSVAYQEAMSVRQELIGQRKRELKTLLNVWTTKSVQEKGKPKFKVQWHSAKANKRASFFSGNGKPEVAQAFSLLADEGLLLAASDAVSDEQAQEFQAKLKKLIEDSRK